MKIYSFRSKVWPYTATICADSAEQAREVYFSDVCTPAEYDRNEPWVSEEMPKEVTRETALEKTSDKVDDADGPSKEEYLDGILLSGVPAVFAVDASLI